MSRASGLRATIGQRFAAINFLCRASSGLRPFAFSAYSPSTRGIPFFSLACARNVVPVHRERISDVQMWRSRGIKALAGSLPCLPPLFLSRQENEVAATPSGATATATLTAANGRPPLRGGPNRSQGCRVTIRGSFQLTAAFRQFEHNNIARGFRRAE